MVDRFACEGEAELGASIGERVEQRVAALGRAWDEASRSAESEAWPAVRCELEALNRLGEEIGSARFAELICMIELVLEPVVAGEERLSGELQEVVRDYLAALYRQARTVVAQVDPVLEREAPRVVIAGADGPLAEELAHQIQHFGYAVETVASGEPLDRHFADQPPHAVILAVDACSECASLIATTDHVRALSESRVPIILLSNRGDVTSRLAAARAGADAYLVTPFDPHELVDQLDRLGQASKDEPHHIVIVEDSATQAAYYSTILRKAGMVATVIADPLQVLDVLNDHAVDLVLMDMYMPHCNGMELAKVIRQVPRHASIPIVFLSAETKTELQLDAMSRGGDDFLTKPINPAHLIRSVSIRAERARTLRSFMLQDNLTGLLNHTRVKEQLHNEAARATRHGTRLSFAMLDIDHFKHVNDTYGHPVGDRVIKTLARVLKQRLRETDSIGRYGGEEFAVILPGAGADEAKAVLDEIRTLFGKIRQFTPDGGFRVTFSGGVATLEESGDAVQLAVNADKALYAAKRGGRDRIARYGDMPS